MTSPTLGSLAPLLVTVLALLLSTPAAAQAESQAEDHRTDPPAEQRAKTYNSSRSNKTDGAAAPADADADADDCNDEDPCVHPAGVRPATGTAVPATPARGVAAQDYNSSRSNKARGEAPGPAEDDACADCEEVAPAGRRMMEREQR